MRKRVREIGFDVDAYTARLIGRENVSKLEGAVLEIVKNFEEASGKKVPYEIKPRRAGDIATCYADATKAKEELGWQAKRWIKEMCQDSWRWQSNNPNGYEAS